MRGALFAGLAVSLAVPLMGAAVPTPSNQPSRRPAVPATALIPHTAVPAGKGPAAPARGTAPAPADSTWPQAASATVDLAAPNVAGAKAPATGWAAAAHPVAGTPVTVRATGALAPPAAGQTGNGTKATAPSTPTTTATSVQTKVLAHTAATAAGVDGVLFSVTPGAQVTSPLAVSLDYSSFTNAAGAAYGSRLQLVELPACALTTPNVAACRTQTPISSAQNDYSAQSLSATVTPAGSGDRTMLLAATSGPTGPTGNFDASTLAPEGSWTAGGNAGDFTWSYPIAVPPASAGQAAPTVSLAYDSAAVDGETGTTNNQSSWVGQGWDYDPGYIERTYQTCSDLTGLDKADQTNDQCWDGQILTMSLAGKTESIVVDSDGKFHLQTDDGSRVQLLTSTTNGNGAHNGEYWEITTPDGTSYYFGMNKAPGFTNQTTTNSVFTEPVYGPNSGDPCNSTDGFSKSVCTQAWRWNLDYVQDAHGNAAIYYYSPETNYYVEGAVVGNAPPTTSPVSYDRGGQLAKIDYGMRLENGSVFGSTAPDQVSFTTQGRCSALDSSCPAFTSANAKDWPDSPVDLVCASGATSCTNYSPAKFTSQRLTTITTQTWNSGTSAYQPVDSYALTQQFPSQGDEELVLNSLVHSGYDATGANPLPEPAITFEGQLYDNRVNGYGSMPGLSHWRMYNIFTETGETIHVTYNTPQCTTSNLPPTTDTTAQQQSWASANTLNCYPVFWTPPGYKAPIFDYFNYYTVQSIQVTDPNALSPAQITNYYYLGGAAWHYDDNELVKASQRTYGQYRGYAQVETTTGDTQNSYNGVSDGLTLTEDTYYRGMDQNTLPNNGTQSATVSDSLGEKVTDNNAFAGQTRESQTFNGATLNSSGLPVPGAEISAVITTPVVVGTTGTRTRTGLPALTATILGTSSTRTYTDLAAGGTTLSEVENSYDSFGRVVASADSGTSVPTKCTTTTYADNTTTWVREKPSEVIVAGQACPATIGSPLTASDIVQDTRDYYDGSTTLGTLPSAGDLTRTDVASVNNAGTLTWITNDTKATYDSSGRQLTATDALGHVTTTTYTPADGGLVTGKVVANPICTATPTAAGCAKTSTTYNPGRGLATQTIDAANHKTSVQYDSLGRVTSVWAPGFPMGAVPASTTYAYVERNDGPEAVTTNTLVDDGAPTNNLNYKTSVTLSDAMGQTLQTQTLGENGSIVGTDNRYDSHGWVIDANDQYATNGTPGTTLIHVADSAVNSRTETTYDGDGRKLLVTQYSGVTPTSAVQTVYGGDRTSTIGRMANGTSFDPGVTASTTVDDVRGQSIELDQYTGAPTVTGSVVTGPTTGTIPGTPGTLATTYTNDVLGQQVQVKDSAGDIWTTTYDLLKRKVQTTDPDQGASNSTFDADGNVLTTKDADGNILSFQYDLLNRKVAEYDSLTQNSGTQIAGWSWDTEQKGQLTSTSTMNVTLSNGSTGTIVNQANGYDTAGRSEGSVITIPAGETGLAGTYTTKLDFSRSGLPTGVTPAAMPGSPTETVTTTYDPLGNPLSAAGYNTIVSAATYTPFSELAQQTLGGSNAPVWQSFTYDPQTRDVIGVNLSAQLTSPQLDNTTYTYNTAQQITAITDAQGNGSSAPVEQQCYSFDALGRLTQAFTAATPTTGACTTDPSVSGNSVVGGPEPYWTTWSFDQLGQRTNQTQHALAGQSGGNTATSYSYGANGHANALATENVTGPTGAANLSGFSYDSDGNTLSYPGSGVAGTQTLGWSQGHLVSDNTTAGDQTTQVNDADGNQLITRDSSTNTNTLYLDGEQLAYNTSTKVSTGTRFYSFNTAEVAERIGGGNPQYLMSDQHATNDISVDSTTMNVTRRELDPYGNQIGTTSGGTWLDQRGFLDKPQDAATGLVDVGARYYDPATGRFLSVDPVFESTTSQELNGYTYSGADPINGSDPTGKMEYIMDGGGGDPAPCPSSEAGCPGYHAPVQTHHSVRSDYHSYTGMYCEFFICGSFGYTETRDGSKYFDFGLGGGLNGWSVTDVHGRVFGANGNPKVIDNFASGWSVTGGACIGAGIVGCGDGVWGEPGHNPFAANGNSGADKGFGIASGTGVAGTVSYSFPVRSVYSFFTNQQDQSQDFYGFGKYLVKSAVDVGHDIAHGAVSAYNSAVPGVETVGKWTGWW